MLASFFRAYLVPIVSWWQRHAGLPNGIESRSPFWDLRVIELLLAMPQWVHRDAGETKSLLRRAMTGLVPQEIVERQDKFVFDALMDRGILGEEADRVSEVIHGPLATLPYLRPQVLEQEIELYQRRRHPWWDGLWRTITAGYWLDFEEKAGAGAANRQVTLV
jgi:asparagine synthase (glutamine-hydrolysing)